MCRAGFGSKDGMRWAWVGLLGSAACAGLGFGDHAPGRESCGLDGMGAFRRRRHRRLAEEGKRRDKRQIINIFLTFLAFLIYFRK